MLIPNLAHMTSPQCPLKKGYFLGVNPRTQRRVLEDKETINLDLNGEPFDRSKETLMLTDASRLYGLGFALIQKVADKASHSYKVGHGQFAKHNRDTPP